MHLYQGTDFITLYTYRRHDEILRNMGTAISEAVGYRPERTKATPVISDLPDLDWFIDQIKFLIANIS